MSKNGEGEGFGWPGAPEPEDVELNPPPLSLEKAQAKSVGSLTRTLIEAYKGIKFLIFCILVFLITITAIHIYVFSEFLLYPDPTVTTQGLLQNEDVWSEFLKYLRYSMIASFSAITVITSSCFLGFKGVLSFLLKGASETTSSGQS